MTAVSIFPQIYFHYSCINHIEFKKYLLENYIEKDSKVSSNWCCNTKNLPINTEKLFSFLKPTLIEFCSEVDKNIDFHLNGAWLNYYNTTDFQEIHSHSIDSQMAMVYFVQYSKETDGKFYFFNQNYSQNELSKFNSLTTNYQNMMSNWCPDVQEGDIILFPSYLLHGVTPHNSQTKRITLAVNCNFKLI